MFTAEDSEVRRLIATVFPKRSVRNAQVLSGGLINTNIRVDFEANHEPIVIRFYRNGAQACRKELAIHDLVSPTIRVPRVLHAVPEGIDDSPAFLINDDLPADVEIELLELINATLDHRDPDFRH